MAVIKYRFKKEQINFIQSLTLVDCHSIRESYWKLSYFPSNEDDRITGDSRFPSSPPLPFPSSTPLFLFLSPLPPLSFFPFPFPILLLLRLLFLFYLPPSTSRPLSPIFIPLSFFPFPFSLIRHLAPFSISFTLLLILLSSSHPFPFCFPLLLYLFISLSGSPSLAP